MNNFQTLGKVLLVSCSFSLDQLLILNNIFVDFIYSLFKHEMGTLVIYVNKDMFSSKYQIEMRDRETGVRTKYQIPYTIHFPWMLNVLYYLHMLIFLAVAEIY